MCNTKVMKNHHTVAPTGRELVFTKSLLSILCIILKSKHG